MLARSLSNTLFSTRSASSGGGFLGGLLTGVSSTISTERALCLSALYNGVNIISNDIAILPKAAYSNANDKKTKLKAHPVTHIIGRQPNKNQTAYHYHKVMTITAILRGNAVAIINRNANTGRLNVENALTFVHPDDIRDIRMLDGELWFFIKDKIYHNSEVIHIKGFSTNGYTGQSVFKHAAQNLNAALKAESFAVNNFESKGFGLGIIKTEKPLNDNGKKVLTDGMSARLSKGGAYNVGILDEGMQFESIQISAKEAELIDWKNTTIEDIARWLNIGTSKLKSTKDHNYSSIEHESINHVQDSITPWTVQFEQEYNMKLYTEAEKTDHYTKFNINALLRSDIKSRAEYYMKMRYSGVLSGDEIRSLEEYNKTDLPHMIDPLQPVQIQQQSQIELTDGTD